MVKKPFTPEEIFDTPRPAEVLLGRGKKVAEIGEVSGRSKVQRSRRRQPTPSNARTSGAFFLAPPP